LYQHGSRLAWETQRERIYSTLSTGISSSLRIRTVRFGAFGVRSFFCISVDSELTDGIQAALDTLRERVASWDRSHYLMVE